MDNIMLSIKYIIVRDEAEKELTIEARVNPGYPAKITGSYEDCYPSEPSSFEIDYIWDEKDKKEFDQNSLTNNEILEIEEILFKHALNEIDNVEYFNIDEYY